MKHGIFKNHWPLNLIPCIFFCQIRSCYPKCKLTKVRSGSSWVERTLCVLASHLLVPRWRTWKLTLLLYPLEYETTGLCSLGMFYPLEYKTSGLCSLGMFYPLEYETTGLYSLGMFYPLEYETSGLCSLGMFYPLEYETTGLYS